MSMLDVREILSMFRVLSTRHVPCSPILVLLCNYLKYFCEYLCQYDKTDTGIADAMSYLHFITDGVVYFNQLEETNCVLMSCQLLTRFHIRIFTRF